MEGGVENEAWLDILETYMHPKATNTGDPIEFRGSLLSAEDLAS